MCEKGVCVTYSPPLDFPLCRREALVSVFRSDLEAQVEALNKGVGELRLLAQHDMVLDAGSEEEAVLEYTRDLLVKVAAQHSQVRRRRCWSTRGSCWSRWQHSTPR